MIPVEAFRIRCGNYGFAALACSEDRAKAALLEHLVFVHAAIRAVRP